MNKGKRLKYRGMTYKSAHRYSAYNKHIARRGWAYFYFFSPHIVADFDRDGDVDGDDLDMFADCSTGSDVPGPTQPNCTSVQFEAADLDADGDVDQSDFGVLQRCLSGTDNPAEPACAD